MDIAKLMNVIVTMLAAELNCNANMVAHAAKSSSDTAVILLLK